jgi:HAD superfamily hydrolase (TIGR01509 family)
MDGLMFDTERIYFETWQKACAEQGFELTLSNYFDFIGRSNAVCLELLKLCFGADFSDTAFNDSWPRHWDFQIATCGLPLKPGLLELLNFLTLNSIKMAVGTSCDPREALKNLEYHRLSGCFEALVTAADVNAGKPEPEIFLTAAKRLGVVPKRCLVLEDSEPGLEAADRAGMRCIVVPDLKPLSESAGSKAFRVCTDLHAVILELRELLCVS